MELPIIAAALAAFLLVLQQVLMMNVGMHRGRTMQGVGHDGDLHLERKVRLHGNLAENAAIFIVVLALAEGLGAPVPVVASFALAFAIARVSHALGFMSLAGSHKPGDSKLFLVLRASGASVTGLIGIALGCYLAFLVATSGRLPTLL